MTPKSSVNHLSSCAFGPSKSCGPSPISRNQRSPLFPLEMSRANDLLGLLGGSVAKESACYVEDLGLSPELGRCPGVGNSNPFQYSSLENSMDRGAWQAVAHGVAVSGTTKQLTLLF